MKFLLLKISGGWKSIGPKTSISNESSIFPPLGLEYLASVLVNDGHNVEIIDLGIENVSREHLNNSVMSSDAVGMSVQIDNYASVAKISETIKEIDPEITQIIGGASCSFLKKQTLSDIPYADICCEAEGEQAIIDITRFLQGKTKLSNIHGIHYRKNNQIKSGKPLKIVNDLDSLPFPARHLVEKYEYGKFLNCYPFKKKFTTMISSRGCPFKCRFCTRYSNVLDGYGFRERSAENVVEEIEEIGDKYRSVMIVDDNFLVDVKRAHKICDMLIERNNDLDLLVMGARVDTASRELYGKMKRAGFKYLGFGIESGNQDVLDFYNKEITLQQVRNAVNLGSEMGFLMAATFILGAPIETRAHIENTIKFACSLPLDMAFFGSLSYQRGSDLWIEAVKNKIISKDESFVPADSRRGIGNFTPEELQTYTKQAFRSFYARPIFLLSRVYRAFARRDYGLVKRGLSYIINS